MRFDSIQCMGTYEYDTHLLDLDQEIANELDVLIDLPDGLEVADMLPNDGELLTQLRERTAQELLEFGELLGRCHDFNARETARATHTEYVEGDGAYRSLKDKTRGEMIDGWLVGGLVGLDGREM